MAVLDVFPAVLIIKLIPTHRHPHRYGSDSIIEVILDYFGAFKASFRPKNDSLHNPIFGCFGQKPQKKTTYGAVYLDLNLLKTCQSATGMFYFALY